MPQSHDGHVQRHERSERATNGAAGTDTEAEASVSQYLEALVRLCLKQPNRVEGQPLTGLHDDVDHLVAGRDNIDPLRLSAGVTGAGAVMNT